MVSAKALASGLEPIASTDSIVGVADSADGWLNARLCQSLGVVNGHVLPAAIAVVNKPAMIGWTAGIKRQLKCIENEVGLGRSRRFPTE